MASKHRNGQNINGVNKNDNSLKKYAFNVIPQIFRFLVLESKVTAGRNEIANTKNFRFRIIP